MRGLFFFTPILCIYLCDCAIFRVLHVLILELIIHTFALQFESNTNT